jgi:hypothetical protein
LAIPGLGLGLWFEMRFFLLCL